MLISAYESGSNYEDLKSSFNEVFGEWTSVQLEDGETISLFMLRCPFCSKLINVAQVGEEDEFSNRYRYLWAALGMHLREKHRFARLMKPLEERDMTTRKRYECALCGKEVRGIVEAVCHVLTHIEEREGWY